MSGPRRQRRPLPGEYHLAHAEGFADAAEGDRYCNAYAVGTEAHEGYRNGFNLRMEEFYADREHGHRAGGGPLAQQ